MEMIDTAALPRELAAVSLVAGPEKVARYAELTVDFNPIHLDPAFAAGTVFRQPIIHGTLGLNLVIEAIERTFGHLPAHLAVEVRFVRPVPVGSTIRAGGHLTDPARGTYEIYVETAAGDRAVEGTCTIGRAPDQENKGANAT